MSEAVTATPDSPQRRDALDPERSFIVQAPAGSGKTELLIQRMLRLLASVEQPEEVVAITFTRKAAAEMRNRLVRELQAAADAPGEAGLKPHKQLSRDLAAQALRNARRREWNLLLQPSRLQVRTIDSLCSDLARRMPVLSGLGGGLRVSEHPEALYFEAATRCLAVIETENDPLHEHVMRVLRRYDNQYDRLLEMLTGMLASRDQWLGHILAVRTDDGFNRDVLEEALGLLVESQLESALELVPDDLLPGLVPVLQFTLQHVPEDAEQLDALLRRAGPDGRELSSDASDLAHWKTLIGKLLTADGKGWRKSVTAKQGFPAPSSASGEDAILFKSMKETFLGLLDGVREFDDLRIHLHAVRMLPEPGYDEDSWASLESLLHILLRAAAEWNLVAAETGEVDFTEISHRAVQSLGEMEQPSELAMRMDYRISHLLVDEFQDTSSSQILLLKRLTAGWTRDDGRSLFLVGDPMQSIYRFRKAEVSLFIQAWNGHIFDQLELVPIQLSVNFRSSRPIVDWVNQAFPLVLPKRDDPVMSAVRYSASHQAPAALPTGGVHIDLEIERTPEQEAIAVVDLVARAEPDERIAVLVRSRKHASEILARLDRLKGADPRYRYQAIDFFKLAETPLVQDLVSLTLALTQPADSLAWLATLRAPFAGLELFDLERLARYDGESLITEALRAAIEESPEKPVQISDDGVQRLRRIAPVLLAALDNRGRQALRTLVESCWCRLGGPCCLSGKGELADAQTYFELLEQLEGEGVPVDRDTLSQRLEGLFARPDPYADGRLQVMTIYAAKGLQFDRVILPGLHRRPSGYTGKLVHWFELAGSDRIAMSPMRSAQEASDSKQTGDLIRFIANMESRQGRLEDGRLAYVAATRAITHLHLLGQIAPGARGQFSPAAGSLLDILWPALAGDQLPRLEAQASRLAVESPAPGPGQPRAGLQQTIRRPAAKWRPPAPPPGVAPALPPPPEVQDYVQFDWAGERVRLTGILAHRLLQMAGEQGLEQWQRSGGVQSRLSWCRHFLAAQGLAKESAEEVIQEVELAISNAVNSEQGQWLLAEHPDAACELGISAVIDDQVRNFVLDRTFVADGKRWIIDYKTSTHAGGDLEGFLGSEVSRYAPQLERYRAAMSAGGEAPVRTALYYPLLDRFCEITGEGPVSE